MAKEYDKEAVREALRQSEGNVTEAANLLGCSRKTIYNHVDKDEVTKIVRDTARKKRVKKSQENLAAIADDVEHKDSFKANVKILEVWDKEDDWSGKQRIETDGAIVINLMDDEE